MGVGSEASAYFLIAHGSRDPRSHQGLDVCARMVRQALTLKSSLDNAWPLVGVGVLEFGAQPLEVQIATFATTVARDGIKQVFLVPLFLSSGNHVNQDLPAAIKLAEPHIPPDLVLRLCPHLGSHPEIAQLVQQHMDETPCDRWILLAHGTRRVEGNQSVETLAAYLGALPAYWSVPPTLETQLQTLASPSIQRIGIIPYFLFTGSIIDAIGAAVNQLQSRFTPLELQVTQPLNPSPRMAQLLLDRCTSAQHYSGEVQST
jgi:sirohydrochlorin ferrochelatase